MNLLRTLTEGRTPPQSVASSSRLQAPVVCVLLVVSRGGDAETHIYSRKTDLPHCSSHWTLWLASTGFPT